MKQVLMLVAALWLMTGHAGASPAPSPDLTPAEVVRIQLDALAHNDTPLPNSGVSVVFRFASPGNRQQTGPLDRFTMMVNSGPYREMLNHRSAEILPEMATPAHTMVPAVLVTAEGREARFVFILTEQTDGPYAGCWMTDAVMPVDRSRSPDRLT